VVFFQDTYHLNIDKIFVAGLPESGGAAPALRAQLAPKSRIGGLIAIGEKRRLHPKWRMAGVVGALLS